MARYLYNGVELPDINEVWDKITYPYAVVVVTEGKSDYALLILTANEWSYNATDDVADIPVDDGGTAYSMHRTLLSGGTAWEEGLSGVATSGFGLTADELKWCSSDILDKNTGAVWMVATEPVAAYETEYAVGSAALIATATAIRAKTGSTEKIAWSGETGFAEAVGGIATGGGDGELWSYLNLTTLYINQAKSFTQNETSLEVNL